MKGKITKIIYWRDKTNEYEDNLYYVQIEYDNKYSEVCLITDEEFEEMRNKYESIMEEAE
jgi:hypothetical protein